MVISRVEVREKRESKEGKEKGKKSQNKQTDIHIHTHTQNTANEINRER
jgi:hypothetical protein